MRGFTRRAGKLFPLLATVFAALLCASRANAEMGDRPINYFFQLEELEYGFDNQENPLSWDSKSWIGGDWNRIWLKTEGEVPTDELAVEAEAQLLYSRLIAPFWELQAGVRGDVAFEPGFGDGRGFLVLGLEGLAPYWFEIEPSIFVSHLGDISGRFRATYDQHITQRLIAQPSLELNVAIQSVPVFGIGSGFNDLELGLRVRYEITRKFAPYLGFSWRGVFGETATLTETAGLLTSVPQGVAGVRLWF